MIAGEATGELLLREAAIAWVRDRAERSGGVVTRAEPDAFSYHGSMASSSIRAEPPATPASWRPRSASSARLAARLLPGTRTPHGPWVAGIPSDDRPYAQRIAPARGRRNSRVSRRSRRMRAVDFCLWVSFAQPASPSWDPAEAPTAHPCAENSPSASRRSASRTTAHAAARLGFRRAEGGGVLMATAAIAARASMCSCFCNAETSPTPPSGSFGSVTSYRSR